MYWSSFTESKATITRAGLLWEKFSSANEYSLSNTRSFYYDKRRHCTANFNLQSLRRFQVEQSLLLVSCLPEKHAFYSFDSKTEIATSTRHLDIGCDREKKLAGTNSEFTEITIRFRFTVVLLLVLCEVTVIFRRALFQ